MREGCRVARPGRRSGPVDIAVTPLANTLPIRRVGLEPGQSADLRVVNVQVGPGVSITALKQRHSRLEPGADCRYSSRHFAADLWVDAEGIVIDYPGLWVRQAVSA